MGLVESGITSEKLIQAGLRKARASGNPFFPSVGQFVNWCKSAAMEAVRLPSAREALNIVHWINAKPRDIRANYWGKHHSAVYEAYTRCNYYDLKSKNEKAQLEDFTPIWDRIVNEVVAGENFENRLPPPSEGARKNAPLPKEEQKKKIGELLDIFS